MPVCLFTFHAYRSWMPDRPQGYVRRHEGILPPDAEMAERYNRNAKHRPVLFEESHHWTMIAEVDHVCGERDWQLHETAGVRTHLHVLLGWRTEERPKAIANHFKRRLGRALSLAANRPGPWFVRGESKQPVRDDGHFEYLLREYLPKHGRFRWTIWKHRRARGELTEYGPPRRNESQ